MMLVNRTTWEATVISPLGSGPEGYSLAERYVTWAAWPAESIENNENNKDVFYYDLELGRSFHIASTREGMQLDTHIDGSRVVWLDTRNGDFDVYMYDIELGQEVLLTDDPFDQLFARIRGDLVVLREYRFTLGHEFGGCASDIFILDVSTMVGRKVTTNPWFWAAIDAPFDGRLLAGAGVGRYYNLYVFDLVEMGILDANGRHVLPD